MDNNFAGRNGEELKEEGEVTVKYAPGKDKKKGDGDDGEYVEFEEVD